MTEVPTRKARDNGLDSVRDDDERIMALVSRSKAPKILAVNKVDLLKDKSRMLPLLQAYQEKMSFDAVVPISARKRLNFDALLSEIRKHLPEGLMYDQEFFTDRPERFFVAELVREAVMNQTRQEVPHGAAALIDDYVVDGNLVRIKATIVVEKASHKGIVIGAGGTRIKTIGTNARQEIEKLLGQKVFLELWVKVIPGWTGDANAARRLATEVEQS